MVKIKKGRKSRVVELREPERKTESGVLTVFTEAFQHPDGYVCLFSTFSYPGGVGKGRLCYVPLFNPSYSKVPSYNSKVSTPTIAQDFREFRLWLKDL